MSVSSLVAIHKAWSASRRSLIPVVGARNEAGDWRACGCSGASGSARKVTRDRPAGSISIGQQYVRAFESDFAAQLNPEQVDDLSPVRRQAKFAAPFFLF